MKSSRSSKEKLRIDQILYAKGLAPSRERAQAMVMAGQVIVEDRRVEKASQKFFPEDLDIRVKGKDHSYVGRGGLKLALALESFGYDPKGMTCLDVGASTGGFTDCLLKRGAKKVYTLDCGSNQLDQRLREDPRVVCRENYNVRFLERDLIKEKINLIVLDVSFISIRLVVLPILQAIPGPWDMIALVKPQFEAGRNQIEKGGIVKSLEVQHQVVSDVTEFMEQSGLRVTCIAPAGIQGTKGNQEYFLWMKWA